MNEVYTGIDGENNLYYHDGTILSTDSYCIYNGLPVFNYNFVDNISTLSKSSENCQKIFSVFELYSFLFGKPLLDINYIDLESYQDFIAYLSTELPPDAIEEFQWNLNNNTCMTVSSSAIVETIYGEPIFQENCEGVAIVGSNKAVCFNQ